MMTLEMETNTTTRNATSTTETLETTRPANPRSNSASPASTTPASQQLRSPIRRQAKVCAEWHAEALNRLSEGLDAFALTASPQALKAIEWVEAALDEAVLSLGHDGRVRGVPADLFERLLREKSQRGPGRELSRRQRATWVRPLNAVREALQPLVSTSLNVVRNYARAPRSHTLTSKANAVLRPSDCLTLMDALAVRTPAMCKAERAQRFVHAALLLIFRAGVTFEGVLNQACNVQAQDLTGNYLRVPMNASGSRWLRVALGETCAAIWQSLAIEGVVPTGKRGRPRKGQALSPLAYLATGTEQGPDDKARVQWRKAINAALAQVSAEAGVPTHPVSAWLLVIRWVLVERAYEAGLPKPVVAYRAGQIDTGALPLTQQDADWSSEPALPPHDAPAQASSRATAQATSHMDLQRRQHHASPTNDASASVIDHARFARGVEALRAALRGREDVPAERHAIAHTLREMARDWGYEQNEVDHNLHRLADWLAALLASKKRLGTLRAYLSDGLWLVRYAGERSVTELGGEDAEAITEPDGRRRASAWTSWRAHLKRHGETLARLGKLKATRRRETREEALLPPAAVAQLFATLEGDARVAAVAGYFGLLRIGEVLHLRLCDLALLGDAPSLEMRNSKGGKSRRVYLIHVPTEAISWLRETQRRVLIANPTLPLETRLRCPLVTIDKTHLERQVRRAMRAIGLPACTFHSLRKSRATALVRRGVDIRLVSRWLGHATVSVTWLSYVRAMGGLITSTPPPCVYSVTAEPKPCSA